MKKSFKQRVEEFWKVFEENEQIVREKIEAKEEAESLVKFVGDLLRIAFDDPYFEMGFSTVQGKYELIMTPEGDRIRLPLLTYWKDKVPASLADRWNFYNTRPALANSENFGLSMFGLNINNDNVRVHCETDVESRKFNLEVYSKDINSLDENKRYSIFFILLDQFLGEAYTMQYVGTIDFVNEDPEETMTLRDLRHLIDTTIDKEEWGKIDNMMELYTGYSMEPSYDEEDILLRTDIFAGFTSCFPILNVYYEENDEAFDTIAENGAIYGFLFYNNTEIPTDNILDVREKITEEIISSYDNNIADVYCIGGATGEYFSYIDFVVFDMDSFLQIVKQVSASNNLSQPGFKYFKKEAEVIDF